MKGAGITAILDKLNFNAKKKKNAIQKKEEHFIIVSH